MTARTLLPFAAFLGLIVWAFAPTFAWMAEKWATDPQYSHGFLVPCFSAFLLYRQRETPGPWRSASWPVAGSMVLAAALAMRVLAGGLLFYQLDALALLLTLAGAVLLVGGHRLFLRTGSAILFLAFMVPLPFELERNVGGPLRNVATHATTFLLQTLGLPAIREGNVILIDDVKLGVAEACSGLKMLLTFAAFSIGAVLLANRSLFEKFFMLLGIVPIAVVTNVLRIAAMGVAHTLTSDKDTTHTLHDVFGWLMMPVGLALLGAELWFLNRLVVRPSPGVRS